MNKNRIQNLILLLATCMVFMGLLVGCDSDSKKATASISHEEETEQKEEIQTTIVDESAPIKFADPTFEKYLRKAMGNMTGEITEEDLAEIKQIGIDINGKAFAISNIPYEYGTFSLSSAYNQANIANYEFLDPDNEYSKKPLLIESLEDLEYFPNLQVLVINEMGEGVQVKNLDFLKSLPDLQCFYSNSLTGSVTLEPFAQCEKLKEINLNNYNVTYENIDDLINCTELKKINIYKVENWSALLEFPELKEAYGIGITENEQIKQKLIEKGAVLE